MSKLVSTYVFSHVDENAAKAINSELIDRYGFGADEKGDGSRITALATFDAMSILDCIRDVLEARHPRLDHYERLECIGELLNASTYEDATKTLREWDIPVFGDCK